MNRNQPIVRVAIATPLWQTFDYWCPTNITAAQLTPGLRVKVPFGRREVTAIVLAVSDYSAVPADKLKSITALLDEKSLLPATLLQLYQWASDYYHYPIGEIILGSLPKLLRQGKPLPAIEQSCELNQTKQADHTLNDQQQAAVAAIQAAQDFKTFLLAGVTGSGKTEVYLQCIAKIIAANKQVLVLVPEIALTPQTIARFQTRFAAVVELVHSNLSAKARAQAWLRARQGEAAIIIGTRSAVFTPLANPGMIILDEEHDPSFKQQSGFRYSARDLAIMRARIEKIPIILGSATPSLESLYNAERKRYHLLRLTERVTDAQTPQVKIIDLRGQRLQAGLSQALLQRMEAHIEQRGQVMLFLNRRGYAPTMMCHHCGWILSCHRCDARLTLHCSPPRLYCHHCGTNKIPPHGCPQCQSSELINLGVGTEQLEQSLAEYFPRCHIVRIDRDSTRKKGSMHAKLQRIHTAEANILLGTQMLAKGHHFANLTLVAIVTADSGFFSADFRSLERMAQLLVQVAGRAGREKHGEVVIQTHQPDNRLLQILLAQGYMKFAQVLLAERQLAAMPPFTHLALLRAEAVRASLPMEFLTAVKKILLTKASQSLEIHGPIPAVMERKAGKYRYQLLLQATQRVVLHDVLQACRSELACLPLARRVRWSLDIDPQETM